MIQDRKKLRMMEVRRKIEAPELGPLQRSSGTAGLRCQVLKGRKGASKVRLGFLEIVFHRARWIQMDLGSWMMDQWMSGGRPRVQKKVMLDLTLQRLHLPTPFIEPLSLNLQ